MSCVEAFDQLTGCYSLGGQVRHYYRYGRMNDCLRQYDKFKFCIFNSDPKAIQDYYRKVAEANKQRGSSEDVWEPRKV